MSTNGIKSAQLKRYSSNLKRVAQASQRDEQMRVARNGKFKASLVDNPIKVDASLVEFFEIARNRGSKG